MLKLMMMALVLSVVSAPPRAQSASQTSFRFIQGQCFNEKDDRVSNENCYEYLLQLSNQELRKAEVRRKSALKGPSKTTFEQSQTLWRQWIKKDCQLQSKIQTLISTQECELMHSYIRLNQINRQGN